MSMPKTVDVIFGSQDTPIYEERDRQLNTILLMQAFLDRSIESLRYCPALGALSSVMSLSTQQTYLV